MIGGKVYRLDHPNWIQIEITNRCNLSCTMCPRNYLKIDFIDMSFEVYQTVVDKLQPNSQVALVGLGEPMMHRHLFDMIDYAKQKGHRVSTTTNGYLMNEKARHEILNSGLDYLRISVDEAKLEDGQDPLNHPYNAKVLENVAKLITLRGSATVPHIMFNVVVSKQNYEIVPTIIRWAQELHVDAVNLIKLAKSGFGVERLTLAEETHLFETYHQLGRELGVEITSNYLTKDNPPPICPFFASFLYVNVHGQATPCCHLAESAFAVGNLLETSLDEIWHGEGLRKFWQKDSQTICQGCHLMLWENEGQPRWTQHPELIFASEPVSSQNGSSPPAKVPLAGLINKVLKR